MSRKLDEAGAARRREIYGFAPTAQRQEIVELTRKRCKALLEASRGQSRAEVRGTYGEIMAALIEADRALNALEEGRHHD